MVFITAPGLTRSFSTEHHEGLIGMSACLHGEISSHLLRGNIEEAVRSALQYRDIFGEG